MTVEGHKKKPTKEDYNMAELYNKGRSMREREKEYYSRRDLGTRSELDQMEIDVARLENSLRITRGMGEYDWDAEPRLPQKLRELELLKYKYKDDRASLDRIIDMITKLNRIPPMQERKRRW